MMRRRQRLITVAVNTPISDEETERLTAAMHTVSSILIDPDYLATKAITVERNSDDDDRIPITIHALKQWRQIASDHHKLNHGKDEPCLIVLDIDSVLKRNKK